MLARSSMKTSYPACQCVRRGIRLSQSERRNTNFGCQIAIKETKQKSEEANEQRRPHAQDLRLPRTPTSDRSDRPRPPHTRRSMTAHVDTNKNVNWMDSRGFWTFYILLLASLYMAMPIVFPSHGDALTAVNVIHGVVSFGIMHWIKGSPDDNSMGDYRELTFYEQIDQGHPWTNTKKFLMMIPTFLFLAASVATDYDTRHLLINFPIWATLILAKLPELDRVRIFGINSTVGIDDHKKN